MVDSVTAENIQDADLDLLHMMLLGTAAGAQGEDSSSEEEGKAKAEDETAILRQANKASERKDTTRRRKVSERKKKAESGKTQPSLSLGASFDINALKNLREIITGTSKNAAERIALIRRKTTKRKRKEKQGGVKALVSCAHAAVPAADAPVLLLSEPPCYRVSPVVFLLAGANHYCSLPGKWRAVQGALRWWFTQLTIRPRFLLFQDDLVGPSDEVPQNRLRTAAQSAPGTPPR